MRSTLQAAGCGLRAAGCGLRAAGCDKIFVEHASGTLAKRPTLTEALAYLREGDSRVTTKLDRLGRSVSNRKQVVDELQQLGVGLKALSQGIDTTTPGGRLFFHLLAAIAEFEHDLIVERTHDGLTAARAPGRKGGPKFTMSSGHAPLLQLQSALHRLTRSGVARSRPTPSRLGACVALRRGISAARWADTKRSPWRRSFPSISVAPCLLGNVVRMATRTGSENSSTEHER